jgi:hypothetical protein
MAIQPIDLSTMYSQMDKVAKYNASQDQNAQLANSVSIGKTVQTNLEKAQQVKQAATNELEAMNVNADGKQSEQNTGSKKKKKEEEVQPEKKQQEIKDPLLGQHIDITR